MRALALAMLLLAAGGSARAHAAGVSPETLQVLGTLAEGMVTRHPDATSVLASISAATGIGTELATWARIALGADALLTGNVDRMIGELETAASIDPDSAAGGEARVALGLGHLIRGERERALAEFLGAADHAEGEALTLASVSAARLLLADGRPAEAEPLFRRAVDGSRSRLADDAALGLARSLVAQRRYPEAGAVLAEAADRYEGRGFYAMSGRDRRLGWERLGKMSPKRLAALLRERADAAVAAGLSPLPFVLGALTDGYVGPDLRRLRRRVGRIAASRVTPETVPTLAIGAPSAPAEPPVAPRADAGGAAARPSLRRGRGVGTVLAVLALAGTVALACAVRMHGRRPTAGSRSANAIGMNEGSFATARALATPAHAGRSVTGGLRRQSRTTPP